MGPLCSGLKREDSPVPVRNGLSEWKRCSLAKMNQEVFRQEYQIRVFWEVGMFQDSKGSCRQNILSRIGETRHSPKSVRFNSRRRFSIAESEPQYQFDKATLRSQVSLAPLTINFGGSVEPNPFRARAVEGPSRRLPEPISADPFFVASRRCHRSIFS